MTNLYESDLEKATFVESEITCANFTKSNLSRAKFTGAKFGATNFALAILTEADFRGCDLTKVNFAGANLAGADLTGATITPAQKELLQDTVDLSNIHTSSKVSSYYDYSIDLKKCDENQEKCCDSLTA